MTVGDGVVAVSVVVAVIILRWHRYRFHKWSINLTLGSERRKDDGPTRKDAEGEAHGRRAPPSGPPTSPSTGGGVPDGED